MSLFRLEFHSSFLTSVARLIRCKQRAIYALTPTLGRPPQPVPFPGVGCGERPLRHRGRGPLGWVHGIAAARGRNSSATTP